MTTSPAAETGQVSHQLSPDVTFQICSCSSLLPFFFFTTPRDSAGFSSPDSWDHCDYAFLLPKTSFRAGCSLCIHSPSLLYTRIPQKISFEKGRFCMQEHGDRGNHKNDNHGKTELILFVVTVFIRGEATFPSALRLSSYSWTWSPWWEQNWLWCSNICVGILFQAIPTSWEVTGVSHTLSGGPFSYLLKEKAKCLLWRIVVRTKRGNRYTEVLCSYSGTLQIFIILGILVLMEHS